MEILKLEQGTKEWQDARLGKVTGTRLADVMGTAYARRCLIAELIAEKATEQAKSFRQSAEMERGSSEEVFAIKWFEKQEKKKVERVGMLQSAEMDWFAMSPDGLIKKGGKYTEAVEVKCPDSKKAMLYRIESMIDPAELGLLTAKGEPTAAAPFLGIPSEYKWQVVAYFLVNPDLERLHFLVYDARFINDDAKLTITTVERTETKLQKAIAEAKTEMELFREQWLRWEETVMPDNF